MRHHHHFYDENDRAAVLVHDHDYERLTHFNPLIAPEAVIYWDHEGDDCSTVPVKETP